MGIWAVTGFVEGSPRRIKWNGSTWKAEAATTAQLNDAIAQGTSVPETADGPAYQPTGHNDEYGIWRLVLFLFDGPRSSGDTPEFPTPPPAPGG